MFSKAALCGPRQIKRNVLAQNRTRLKSSEVPPIKVFVRWTSAAFDFEQARFCSELHQDKTYWCQESKGIRQWLINLCTWKFEHSTNWINKSKFIKSTQGCYYKTFGTSVINSPMSPSSLSPYIGVPFPLEVIRMLIKLAIFATLSSS